MNQKYNDEEKQSVIGRYRNGESVATLVKDTAIPRSTIYAWIQQSTNAENKTKEVSIRNFRILENKVVRLQGIIEILQKSSCRVDDPLDVKLYALEELYGQYSVHMLCDALKVPLGTFYNHINRNKRDNTWYAKRREELKIQIQEVYDDNHQIFGAGKIAAVLKNNGYHTSVEMVRELMRDMGLISIRQDAKDLYDKESMKYRNYLNQNFHASKPNQIWVSDVTFFKCNGKGYYICAIIDLFSRRVVGHRVSLSCSTQLISSTLKSAYQERHPADRLIFHSDRGSNYQSKRFCELLRSLNMVKSVSRAHVPYDNSVMETFFSSMKREELYRKKYHSEREFLNSVDEYISFYNTVRPHAKMQYKTPEQKEAEYANKHRDY